MATTTPPPLKVHESPLVGRREAARFLSISTATLDRFVGTGRVQSIPMGRQRRFHREHLEQLVKTGIPEGVAS